MVPFVKLYCDLTKAEVWLDNFKERVEILEYDHGCLVLEGKPKMYVML